MKAVDNIALVLIIIGAINWGFVGLLEVNLVESLFGVGTVVSRIIYSLVGLTGLINVGILFTHLDED